MPNTSANKNVLALRWVTLIFMQNNWSESDSSSNNRGTSKRRRDYVVLFFELELRRIDDADLEAKMSAPTLARYRPWLRDMRAYRPYQLSDEVEKLLLEKSVAGRSAWVRLFDETIAELRFPFKGRDFTETEILDRLSDPDGETRKLAAQTVGKVLGENIRPFALITNTLAKDKQLKIVVVRAPDLQS